MEQQSLIKAVHTPVPKLHQLCRFAPESATLLTYLQLSICYPPSGRYSESAFPGQIWRRESVSDILFRTGFLCDKLSANAGIWADMRRLAALLLPG